MTDNSITTPEFYKPAEANFVGFSFYQDFSTLTASCQGNPAILKRKPNLDVVIENQGKSKYKAYGIECKFSEPYSKWEGRKSHRESLSSYLQVDGIWEGLPHLKALSDSKGLNEEYQYLDMPQMVKHLLGLTRKYGKKKFRLLYLWYDVPGEEGWQHRREIQQFLKETEKDQLKVSEISYKELFARLSDHYMNGNEEYMGYLSDRYF